MRIRVGVCPFVAGGGLVVAGGSVLVCGDSGRMGGRGKRERMLRR